MDTVSESAFHGQRCLITGGSSGIGRAVGELLAGHGAHVCLLARGLDRLQEAESSLEALRRFDTQVFGVLQADVADDQEIRTVVGQWVQEVGPPDVLVNSAGVARPGYAQDLSIDVYHQMMEVNYFGTVHVTQAVLPAMLARGFGHIVNVSSIAGFLGVFGYTAYGASKFAVRGYSDALRAELKPRGVHVSIAYPPDTDTPQLAYENQFKPPETKALAGSAKLMSPERVAQVILEGIERKRYLILPGWEAKVLYWLSGALGPLLYPIMDIMVRRARAEVDHGELER